MFVLTMATERRTAYSNYLGVLPQLLKKLMQYLTAIREIDASKRMPIWWMSHEVLTEFLEKRDELTDSQKKFNVYDTTESRFVECCLWPHLYPTRNWCETGLEGQSSRLSTKISFLHKVQSTILDYGTDYDLLHFHYDLWLFKTVSGALTSCRFRMCSPARSLETKPFSVEYWKWQHRFLFDAVLQCGPSIFLSISFNEWSFPVPPWLASLRFLTGKGATQLPSFETTHITHVLEQIIRGYLCVSNEKKWSKHVFNYNNIATFSNIQTYFYRFEFQGRGTVFVHRFSLAEGY